MLAPIALAQRMARIGAVERGEEAVACRVDLTPPESVQLCANERMMTLDQIRPGSVAKFRGLCGRADDVGEQDRREDRVRFRPRPHALREGDDLLYQPLSEEEHRVGASDLHLAGVGDALGYVGSFAVDDVAVEHERRYTDRGQHVPDVDRHGHTIEGDCGSRTRLEPHRSYIPLLPLRVVGYRRGKVTKHFESELAISPTSPVLLDGR